VNKVALTETIATLEGHATGFAKKGIYFIFPHMVANLNSQ